MDDGEMVRIVGQGDALEEDVDGEEESVEPPDKSSTLARAKSPEPSLKVQKNPLPDCWDDSDWEGQEDLITGEQETPTSNAFDEWMDADNYSESDSSSSEEGLSDVLLAMQMLKAEFDEKFKAMWA